MAILALMMMASSCIGDSCGWIAAFVALLAAGTYGVPIKATLYQITDLNPFIFQTYKTVVFFIVSFGTIFVLNMPFRMTLYYGTMSGLLWVLGGTGGIVAVRWAGLATAVGTWASVMICVNFFWGILVFHEPVANIWSTVGAFALLTLGLIGMSVFGEPPPKLTSILPTTIAITNSLVISGGGTSSDRDDDCGTHKKDSDVGRELPLRRSASHSSSSSSSNCDNLDESEETQTSNLLKHRRMGNKIDDEETATVETDSVSAGSTPTLSNSVSPSFNSDTHVRLFGNKVFSKRHVGILAALFNGLMSGSSLIPMHFAKRTGDWGGFNYLISYSTGAMLSCFSIWIIYYVVLLIRIYRTRTLTNTNTTATATTDASSSSSSCIYYFQQAASKMPDIYWEQLWKSGLAAGLLNAIGMIGSVIAVTYLGQGVGNSVIQCKIIVRYVYHSLLSLRDFLVACCEYEFFIQEQSLIVFFFKTIVKQWNVGYLLLQRDT
jgi:hypothetical protein